MSSVNDPPICSKEPKPRDGPKKKKKKLPDGMVERPGRRGYYADFKVGGRRIQKKLGTDFDAARTIFHDLRARAEKAEFSLLDNDYLLSELKSAFLKRCGQELRGSTVERYRLSLECILKSMAIRKVNQITADKVLAFREERLAQKTSPRTINHDVTILSAMLRWGVDKSLIGSNPLKKVKPLLHDNPKEGRPLTDEEVGQLLEKSTQPWRDIWYALLVTGMRKDELASLQFRDVDWKARELVIRGGHAKNHRERLVPIDDDLFTILEQQAAAAPQRQPGCGRTPAITARVRERLTRQHVFVNTQNTPLTHRSGLYGAFMRCCRLAAIQTKTYDSEGRAGEHVDLHSLRRTFATNAIVNNADPKSVQEILGHRTLDMTMRIYTKVKGAPKRLAVGRLSYGKGISAPAHVLPIGQEKRAENLPLSLPVPKTGESG